MLYRLTGNGNDLQLAPLPFRGAPLEIALEALLAEHLFDTLFEDAPLLTIFRERQGQAIADIYALNAAGDLVIFELKRAGAGTDAVQQVLRYAQEAGRWTYGQIHNRYEDYMNAIGAAGPALSLAHQEAFELDRPLEAHEFNRRQHLWVIGSAAETDSMAAVDYWRAQGLSISFVPYRIYDIGDQQYFEFFSPPYDRHRNLAESKGVMFDTNRAFNENSVWDMLENQRISAYGPQSYFARRLADRDIVFYSHKYVGIVAAAEVRGPTRGVPGDEEYHDVRFLTQVPTRAEGIAHARSLSFRQVSQLLGRQFYWASTVKVPYLSLEEANRLLDALRQVTG